MPAGDGIPGRRKTELVSNPLEEFARRSCVLPTGERAKGWRGSALRLREPRFPPPDGLGG